MREDAPSAADLRELTEYRQAFAAAYSLVLADIRQMGLEPTGRPAKSTSAIIDKLKRESIRLSQIQDIAGLRVVVGGIEAQDVLVTQVAEAFPRSSVIDRRARPSHGYRAVHLVVTVLECPVEVQVRTSLQQRWAELSEKLSDRFGAEIKYGGGSTEVRDVLDSYSELIASLEGTEREATQLRLRSAALTSLPPDLDREIRSAMEKVEFMKGAIQQKLDESIAILRAYKREE